MKKTLSLFFSIFLVISVLGQEPEHKDTLSLLFIGDIMGHGSQIVSAFDTKSKTYNYDSVFKKVSKISQGVDFTVANLEVTLAGKPYKGYPRFSSPDALAASCKKHGISVLVTANNHSCDRGKKGIIRTLNALDSLGIKHTGTFRNKTHRDTTNLLILQKNNIRVGLLNYTYGTNGLPIPPPTIVNLIDTALIARDIEKSRTKNIDKLIAFLHWGGEYVSYPNKAQKRVADFLFKKGVDIVIGAHPHVLQPMEYHPKDSLNKERFIAYSLGNFVSNQRLRKRDGGAMVQITLEKTTDGTFIIEHGYYLTWVYKFKIGALNKFEVIPCSEYEHDNFKDLGQQSIDKMNIFLQDTRSLFKKENKNVQEIHHKPKQGQIE